MNTWKGIEALDRKQYYKAQNQKRRQIWREIFKIGGLDKCCVCGYSKCFAAIDFHHKVPSEKEFNIAVLLHCVPNSKRIAELQKVIPLCRNCHMEYHYPEKH